MSYVSSLSAASEGVATATESLFDVEVALRDATARRDRPACNSLLFDASWASHRLRVWVHASETLIEAE